MGSPSFVLRVDGHEHTDFCRCQYSTSQLNVKKGIAAGSDFTLNSYIFHFFGKQLVIYCIEWKKTYFVEIMK